jgi:hypothetical protein
MWIWRSCGEKLFSDLEKLWGEICNLNLKPFSPFWKWQSLQVASKPQAHWLAQSAFIFPKKKETRPTTSWG